MSIPAAVAAVALVLAGCRPAPARMSAGSGTDSVTAMDTLRGTFVLEGAEPMAHPVLRVSGRSVPLLDAPRDLLRLTGADVRLTGHPVDRGRFRVGAFLVRAVGGLPAWDGVLARLQSDDPSAYALVLADGSVRRLRGAPETFRGMVGQRIWLVESSDGQFASYGVITPAGSPR